MSVMSDKNREKEGITPKKSIEKYFEPLSDRTYAEAKPYKREWEKVLGIIAPVIIYVLYVTFLSAVAGEALNHAADKSEESAKLISANKVTINAWIRAVVIVFATLMQIPSLAAEKIIMIGSKSGISKSDKGRRKAESGTEGAVYIKRIIYTIILGATLALSLNILISMSGIMRLSKGYEAIADRQFGLALLPGIILYGIISPVAEEVVFRGIIYNRIRRCAGLYPALILSAVMFGVYHNNIVQGIYGLLMGLVIAWVYERYGGFLYPCFMHSAANIFIYAISSTNGGFAKAKTLVILLITSVIAILTLYKMATENKS